MPLLVALGIFLLAGFLHRGRAYGAIGKKPPPPSAVNLIRHPRQNRQLVPLSYLTLEVEIDHGRVIPSEPGQLPASGKGLLTILPAAGGNTSVPPKRTPLETLEALQKHLHLDDQKVAAWMATVRDARR